MARQHFAASLHERAAGVWRIAQGLYTLLLNNNITQRSEN